MSAVPQYLVEKKARKFDEIVSRAHRSRVFIERPGVMTKGSSVLGPRREKGLSLITKKYKRLVKNQRKRPRRKG